MNPAALSQLVPPDSVLETFSWAIGGKLAFWFTRGLYAAKRSTIPLAHKDAQRLDWASSLEHEEGYQQVEVPFWRPTKRITGQSRGLPDPPDLEKPVVGRKAGGTQGCW